MQHQLVETIVMQSSSLQPQFTVYCACLFCAIAGVATPSQHDLPASTCLSVAPNVLAYKVLPLRTFACLPCFNAGHYTESQAMKG